MEKRILVKETESVELDVLTGKLERLAALIQSWINKKWDGIELSLSYDSSEFELYRFREENDKEFEARMEKIKMQKIKEDKKKERRRQQYEVLRKEFESK